MRTLRNVIVALAATVLVVAPVADADSPALVLSTAAVFVGSDDTLFCRILNVGTSSSQITVDIIDNSGDTQATFGPVATGPGGSAQAFVNGNLNIHCRFTVVNGKKDQYRGVGCLFPQGGGITKSFRDCIPAD